MKLLFCQDCGDIVAPHRQDMKVRWCNCRTHAIWWVDGTRGILRVHDTRGYNRYAFVIGLHNRFLGFPGNHIGAEDVKAILDDTPDTYIFKRINSPVIRIRPGYSNDTAWEATLPPETANG